MLDSPSQSVKYEFEKRGVRGMTVDDATLDPDIVELIDSAFAKSWQFVRTDPKLANEDLDELRLRLSHGLTRLARNGQRDMWRLANDAIAELRRDRPAA
jgi:hypothetical protein